MIIIFLIERVDSRMSLHVESRNISLFFHFDEIDTIDRKYKNLRISCHLPIETLPIVILKLPMENTSHTVPHYSHYSFVLLYAVVSCFRRDFLHNLIDKKIGSHNDDS